VLKHPIGHSKFKLIFAPSMIHHVDEVNSFSVDIDDCDCDSCVDVRKSLRIQQYATIELNIDVGSERLTQRLTPEEAMEISEILRIYSTELSALSEEMGEDNTLPEEYA